MEVSSTRPLLLGISGIEAEEYAIELGVRGKLLDQLAESGKASFCSITFRPHQRAVVFHLVKHEGRIYWHAYEGEASQAHSYFEELISDE